MARNLSVVFVIGQIILSAISIQAWTKFDFNKTFNNLIPAANILDSSNILDTILNYDWTKNHECLNELKAIKNGFNNREEWAMKCKLNSY